MPQEKSDNKSNQPEGEKKDPKRKQYNHDQVRNEISERLYAAF